MIDFAEKLQELSSVPIQALEQAIVPKVVQDGYQVEEINGAIFHELDQLLAASYYRISAQPSVANTGATAEQVTPMVQ